MLVLRSGERLKVQVDGRSAGSGIPGHFRDHCSPGSEGIDAHFEDALRTERGRNRPQPFLQRGEDALFFEERGDTGKEAGRLQYFPYRVQGREPLGSTVRGPYAPRVPVR